MIAGSPLRNDISNLGQGSQVEMQHTSNAYHQHHNHSSAISWKQMTEGFSLNGQILGADQLAGGGGGQTSSQMMQHQHHMQHQNMGGGGPAGAYDQMMGFQSDEEDCFDQLSDQGGDDSVSSVGLDDTRIQQL